MNDPGLCKACGQPAPDATNLIGTKDPSIPTLLRSNLSVARLKCVELVDETLAQQQKCIQLEAIRFNIAEVQRKTRALQLRLQTIQRQVDTRRQSNRQRAKLLVQQWEAIQESYASTTTMMSGSQHNNLIARTGTVCQYVHEEQARLLRELMSIFQFDKQANGTVLSLCNLAIPLSFDQYIQKASHSMAEMSNALGLMTILMDVAARLLQVPILHHSQYCGKQTIIWHPADFWDGRASFDSSAPKLLLHKLETSREAFYMLQRSAGVLTSSHIKSSAVLNLSHACPSILLMAYLWRLGPCGMLEFNSVSVSGDVVDAMATMQNTESILVPEDGSSVDEDTDDWEEIHTASQPPNAVEQTQHVLQRVVSTVVADTIFSVRERVSSYLQRT